MRETLGKPPWERVRPNGLVEVPPWLTKLIGERPAVAGEAAAEDRVRPERAAGSAYSERPGRSDASVKQN